MEPIQALLRDGRSFEWGEEQQTVFDKVKEQISTHILLHHFDPHCLTRVNTDASDYGLGFTLTQIQHGKEVTIAYASKTLSKAERNYAPAEKEALTCIWACEKFSKFLLGREFKLWTDQHALKTLLKSTARADGVRKHSKFL